jgi:hypothetical protein
MLWLSLYLHKNPEFGIKEIRGAKIETTEMKFLRKDEIRSIKLGKG